jgi:hypothetical protein
LNLPIVVSEARVMNIGGGPVGCIYNSYYKKLRLNPNRVGHANAEHPNFQVLCRHAPIYTPATCGQLQDHHTTASCCGGNGETPVSDIFIVS